jgi:hypothetical protein
VSHRVFFSLSLRALKEHLDAAHYELGLGLVPLVWPSWPAWKVTL